MCNSRLQSQVQKMSSGDVKTRTGCARLFTALGVCIYFKTLAPHHVGPHRVEYVIPSVRREDKCSELGLQMVQRTVLAGEGFVA